MGCRLPDKFIIKIYNYVTLVSAIVRMESWGFVIKLLGLCDKSVIT